MKFAKLLAPTVAAAALLLAIPGTAHAASSITVTPATGLKNGTSVTVAGSGFPAGLMLFIVECHALTATGCDTGHLGTTTTSATGSFSVPFKVVTGTVGDGSCAAGGSCFIVASDAAKSASGMTKISFASASAPATTATTAASGSGSAPTAVNAGSGGGADRNDAPLGVVLLAIVGGAAVVAGGVKVSRR